MSHSRPGVKITLWSAGFTNQEAVDPPWLLKTLVVLAILSMVASLLYAAATGLGAISVPPAEEAIYIAVLHFVLPVVVIYTVTTNSPASRFLILGYFVTVYTATPNGKGFLGAIDVHAELRTMIATVILIAIGSWLFLSPKMRFYFALIAGKPIPSDLESRAARFMDQSKLNPKVRMVIDWIVDHIETVALLGLTRAVIFTLFNM